MSAIVFKWSDKSPPQQVSITTAATKACTINYQVTGMIRHDKAIKPSGSQIWPQEYSHQSHEHEENAEYLGHKLFSSILLLRSEWRFWKLAWQMLLSCWKWRCSCKNSKVNQNYKASKPILFDKKLWKSWVNSGGSLRRNPFGQGSTKDSGCSGLLSVVPETPSMHFRKEVTKT